MEYREINKTGLKVSSICLGTMTFGTPVGENDAIKLVHWAIDNGINFIDTANMYEGYKRYLGSPGGVAEEILGKALYGRRNKVVLATKVGMQVGPGIDDKGLGRRHILREIDKSLKRLQTDYIDIYYLHKPDPDTPLEETLSVFDELIVGGKIRYYGISNYSTTQLEELLDVCEKNNIKKPVVCQPPYSLLKRDIEKDLLPLCVKENISVVPYQVLQGGLLTGKYKRGTAVPPDSRKAEKKEWIPELTDDLFDKLEKIEDEAKKAGSSIGQFALAWVLAQPGIVAVVLGVKRIEQLKDNMDAVSLRISNMSLGGENNMQIRKSDDASGRGSMEGYKVSFPSVMYRYNEDEISAVVEVMRKAEPLTQGKYMRQFESDFCQYTGAGHAFAVDNATNALRLSATLCGLRTGDEAIIPAYTFCATGIAFGHTGAKIVWADIDPDTRVVSPEDIARKITRKTKAIVVVHLLGMPVDMDPIMKLAEKHKIKVVEDCAQAPGAEYKGKKVGSIGDFGCFSFHGAKNMTTLGEGGILTVKSDEDAKLVPGLRHNGYRAYPGERKRYWVPAMGNVDIDIDGVWPYNFCLGEAQCALGSQLLKRLDSINDTLRKQAMLLRDGLSGRPELSFQKIPEGHKHVFHVVAAKFDGSKIDKTRNDLMDILVFEYKIRAIVQYYPLYRYPIFQKMGFGKADCPNLEEYWDKSFSFPWWCGIPDETLDYLIESTKKAIAKLKRG